MGALTTIKPGLQTLIQDQGRRGLAFYAIPGSGPLDPQSADLANAILDNRPDAPVIECHHVAPTLRFESPATICLTGADMQWEINGQAVRRQATLTVSPGSILAGQSCLEGCRAYVGVRGWIETERTFGSAACLAICEFGGNHGKPLAVGDVLEWREPTSQPTWVRVDQSPFDRATRSLTWRPGPEFSWLTPASRKALQAEPFVLTPQSNRMGARLAGPSLATAGQTLEHSVPTLPGVVQLLPSGQCIVSLQDGPTTGGYPRVGFLASDALRQLNQIQLSTPFYFELAIP